MYTATIESYRRLDACWSKCCRCEPCSSFCGLDSSSDLLLSKFLCTTCVLAANTGAGGMQIQQPMKMRSARQSVRWHTTQHTLRRTPEDCIARLPHLSACHTLLVLRPWSFSSPAGSYEMAGQHKPLLVWCSCLRHTSYRMGRGEPTWMQTRLADNPQRLKLCRRRELAIANQIEKSLKQRSVPVL